MGEEFYLQYCVVTKEALTSISMYRMLYVCLLESNTALHIVSCGDFKRLIDQICASRRAAAAALARSSDHAVRCGPTPALNPPLPPLPRASSSACTLARAAGVSPSGTHTRWFVSRV